MISLKLTNYLVDLKFGDYREADSSSIRLVGFFIVRSFREAVMTMVQYCYGFLKATEDPSIVRDLQFLNDSEGKNRRLINCPLKTTATLLSA